MEILKIHPKEQLNIKYHAIKHLALFVVGVLGVYFIVKGGRGKITPPLRKTR